MGGAAPEAAFDAIAAIDAMVEAYNSEGAIPPVVPGLPVELVSLSGDARPRVFAIENFISDDEIDALLAQAKDRLQAAKTLE